MPVCFQFTKPDGTIQKLQEVDRELCEELRITEDPKRYCPLYQLITWIGVAMCKETGKVTKESFDAYATTDRDVFYVPGEELIARSFLYERYTFSAWYQSR